MSHDLRTPVHSLQCASGLLLERPAVIADKDAMMLLRAIRSSSYLLQTTNQNVLDLKTFNTLALTGGTLRLTARDVINIRAKYDDCICICQDAYGITLRREDVCEAAVLLGSAAELRNALLNVAVSACRLQEASSRVDIGTSLRTQSRASGTVVVEATFVLPSRRLAEADKAALFDPHTSVVGTSLCVARSLARAMGGDVAASCGDSGICITARFTLLQPGAVVSDLADAISEAATSATAAPPPPPPPPMVELTTKMLDHLLTSSTSTPEATSACAPLRARAPHLPSP